VIDDIAKRAVARFGQTRGVIEVKPEDLARFARTEALFEAHQSLAIARANGAPPHLILALSVRIHELQWSIIDQRESK